MKKSVLFYFEVEWHIASGLHLAASLSAGFEFPFANCIGSGIVEL